MRLLKEEIHSTFTWGENLANRRQTSQRELKMRAVVALILQKRESKLQSRRLGLTEQIQAAALKRWRKWARTFAHHLFPVRYLAAWPANAWPDPWPGEFLLLLSGMQNLIVRCQLESALPVYSQRREQSLRPWVQSQS